MRSRLYLGWIGISLLFASSTAIGAYQPNGLEVRGGLFMQTGAWTAAPGFFWLPQWSFLTTETFSFFVEVDPGIWVAKDPFGTPDIVLSTGVGPGFRWISTGLEFKPQAGVTWSSIHNILLFNVGASIRKDFDIWVLGKTWVGVQTLYLNAKIETIFIGGTVGWRW